MKYFLLLPSLGLAVLFSAFFSPSIAHELPLKGKNPVELGQVNWLRDLDHAVKKSNETNKPILVLFQEVPGCSTCQHYGQEVLSHPLVVEAIESLFVPLAIFNNKGGTDAEVLKMFGEPAWNNPVVRIIDETKDDVVGRLSANYSLHGLVSHMILALQVKTLEIPEYLHLLNRELAAQKNGTAEANLAMYCFWSGEKNLGQLEGVVETQAGFMQGHEVVKVRYDPSIISLTDLVKTGQKSACADLVFVDQATQQKEALAVLGAGKVEATSSFRLDGTPKYYLAQSPYRFLPMTQLQAARANSLLAQQQSPAEVLSPRQRGLAAYIAAHPKQGWTNQINAKDFVKAWEEVQGRR